VKGVSSTIIAIVFILAVIGLVTVASISMVRAENLAACSLLNRQILWVVLALIGMFVVMRIDYHVMARLSPWLLAGTLLLLTAVLIPGIGVHHKGARRWIRFLGFGVQPSEMAKLAVVLFVSWWLSHGQERVKSFRFGLLPVLLVCGVTAALILAEPDLGTASLILIAGAVTGLLAGVRVTHVLPFVLPAIPFLYYTVWAVKWRYDRLLAFMDPWKYYDGAGYQLCQALVALGSGGISGVGPGQSRQKLGFLPEAIHDFAFAILGEELGLIGTMLVLLLFAALVWYGMRVAAHARDVLGFLIAAAVTMMIGLQALVNMAVVTGSMPTKGISLPFVSFGGSSLFFLMLMVGLLVNVARQAESAAVPSHGGGLGD
jgi:cell division protein FtsW